MSVGPESAAAEDRFSSQTPQAASTARARTPAIPRRIRFFFRISGRVFKSAFSTASASRNLPSGEKAVHFAMTSSSGVFGVRLN